MVTAQIRHALMRAARRSPLAGLIRALRRGPLQDAIRIGRVRGWDEAADAFLRSPDPLRHLRRDINRDYEVELLLTAVRARFLTMPSLVESHTDLAISLIEQCANNEYVWYVSDFESSLLGSAPVVVRSMYQHEDVAPFASLFADRRQVYAEERAIKDSIPAFSPINDPTSCVVREMYEAYPYPRWIQLTRPAPREQMMRGIVGDLDFLSRPFDALVPGCGTGRKAIQLAMAFSHARILCADLSRSSLAYMMRMARQFDVSNIEPLQIDIYDLPKLGRGFDYIECSGVLHHLGDPVRGGRALVACLRPDGVLRFSMYSELARREIVRHRKQIGEDRIPTMTSDDIRAYRHKVMIEEPECIDRLPTPGDFFDLSRCKDLIMHPNEYRYTVPQLAGYMRDIGVEFCGFSLPPLNRHAYWTAYPRGTDLDAWWKFEQRNPDVFENLYDVWCMNVSTLSAKPAKKLSSAASLAGCSPDASR